MKPEQWLNASEFASLGFDVQAVHEVIAAVGLTRKTTVTDGQIPAEWREQVHGVLEARRSGAGWADALAQVGLEIPDGHDLERLTANTVEGVGQAKSRFEALIKDALWVVENFNPIMLETVRLRLEIAQQQNISD